MPKAKAKPVDYRASMAKVMAQTVADEAKYHNATYRAVRPQEVLSSYKTGEEWVSDCSNGVRGVAHVAKVPDDPAGNNYGPYGNSSSIWLHLPHAPLSEVEVGDIFTFGYSTGEAHACMAYDVTNPKDPVVWNMGTQGQPVFRRLSQEIVGHPGMTVTLCKIKLPPAPVPAPIAKLRAEKGYFAWLAWTLGEQDWHPYGAANKTVRPNVPRAISPVWLAKRRLFIARRKKPNAATSAP